MPKLPNEKICLDTTNNGRIFHEASVSVDSRGRFAVSLPPEVKDTCYQFTNAGGLSQSGTSVAYGRNAVMRVEGNVLLACIESVKKIIAHHYAVQTTEECVLAYKFSSGFDYWKNPDGTITFNGGASDADPKGAWAGALSRARRGKKDEPEGLMLCAFALNKKTHVRGDTKTVEWAFWRAKDHMDDSDIRARLNALSPGEAPESPDSDNDAWVVVPYDEKSAHFFYRTIHSLCRIDDQLRSFFTDRSKVAKAIETGAPFALMP